MSTQKNPDRELVEGRITSAIASGTFFDRLRTKPGAG